MEISPEEKKKIYEEEKAHLEAQEMVKKELQEERSEKRRKGCLGCFSVIVIIFLIAIIGSLSDSSGSKSSSRSVTSKGGSTSSEARIYSQGLETIFVATNKDYFNRLIKASKSDDSYYQILLLVGTGNVFSVPNNTKVRVIDWDYLKIKATKVKITEGSYKGKVVWVPYEWVK